MANTEPAHGLPSAGAAERERKIRRLFRISLWLKAADSVVELVAGLALLLGSGDLILRWVRGLTQHELLEDPNDVVATTLLHWAEALSLSHQTSASLYLLSHGVVKLFLVAMVLLGKKWAYPVFMAALGVLIVYQTYQLTLGFSIWLLGLTVLDAIVLVLTWHEYGFQRRAGQ
jgi:uncharacterized membrane protein